MKALPPPRGLMTEAGIHIEVGPVAARKQFWFGNYELNLSTRRLYRDGVEAPLLRSEYLLLRILATKRGKALSRRQLMQAVWGTATLCHGSLETLVDALRTKLDDEQALLVASVQGNSYSLLADDKAQRHLEHAANIP